MVKRVVEDVFDSRGVLILGLEGLRPEPPPEDVVAAPVAVVEGACVGAVQVTHAVGEVGQRRLDDEVVVIAHEAADVDPPAITAPDTVEDREERLPIGVVGDDR
jgi:hypothetical protein